MLLYHGLFHNDLGRFQSVMLFDSRFSPPHMRPKVCRVQSSRYIAAGFLSSCSVARHVAGHPFSHSSAYTVSVLFIVVCVMVPWSCFIGIFKLLM